MRSLEPVWIDLATPLKRKMKRGEGAAAEVVEVEVGVRVRWLLRPITGMVQAMADAKVRQVMSQIVAGAHELEEYGFDKSDFGMLGDIEVLAGLASFVTCSAYAEALLVEWDIAEDGEPIEAEIDKLAIRRLLMFGAGESGQPLMNAFQRWLDAPVIRRAQEGEGFAASRSGAGAAE